MSDAPEPSTPDSPPPAVAHVGRWSVNEDWAATIVGLALIALVLTGVIPVGLVP
ncbi:hypothetical protein [Catellatospora tritici]|uniref:hypothetical protein n=1 Tax=Catellatospora tritici TaxID=2851566 RepID=UPI001C2DCB27|nr:hypothetical protein [Catellatospora tritici]MBV1854678.1 hypothetical protein [Catellatospora tritici]